MTDTRKPEDRLPENKQTPTDELKDSQLEKVTGGLGWNLAQNKKAA